MIKRLQKYYGIAIVVFVILIIMIAFQTYQQIFYVTRYKLADEVNFYYVLRNHFHRWLIWFFMGLALPFFVKQDTHKKKKTALLIKYFMIVIALVLLNITVISVLQIVTYGGEFTLQSFFTEYFSFYFFQKAPIYTLGYLAFITILFYHFENEKLQITVQELEELKEQHEKEYNLLKISNIDKTPVLSIKIGNTLKVIPIVDIVWIEADDYCVIIHTGKKPSYSMRVSLKSLEHKLPNHFMRVHRKGIVNMNEVKEFKNGNDSKLILKNDDEVPVSKGKIKEVKAFLRAY